MAKSMIFHNLKNLSKSVAAESDIIKANVDRVAVPLAGLACYISLESSQSHLLIRSLRQGWGV